MGVKDWDKDGWDEETLNHPEVKALIESGEWDKMSHMGQRWVVIDLTPWAPGARESLEQTIAEADLAYRKAGEAIPYDYDL